MLKITPSKQLQISLISLFFTYTIDAQVGINTDSPAYQFQMINSGAIGAAPMAGFENNATDGVALFGVNYSTSNSFNGFEGGTSGTSAGVFGLAFSQDNGNAFNGTGVFGQTNDLQGIGVLGARSFSGSGPNSGLAGAFFGALGYTGGFFNISDRKFKKNIESINSALEILTQLNPVKYEFNTEKYPHLGLSTTYEFGFIAQEIETVIPTIVQEKLLDINITKEKKLNQQYKTNRELFKMVNYIEVIPILTKGIQEQQGIIENQNQKIETLENKLAELESKVNALINKND